MSQTDLELLAIEAATIYVLTVSGRILHRSSPDHEEGPRFRLSSCASGCIVQLRHDVGDNTARAIEDLAAQESVRWHPDCAPVHLNEYRRLLAVDAPVESSDTEKIWTFPDRLDYDHSAELVSSDTPAGDRLLALLAERGMLEPLFDLGFVDVGELWAPWCVALQGEEIASIAFTVGMGPASAEVGVATLPGLRGAALRRRRPREGHRSQRTGDEPCFTAQAVRMCPPSGSRSDSASVLSAQI